VPLRRALALAGTRLFPVRDAAATCGDGGHDVCTEQRKKMMVFTELSLIF
jgi:hypothetical protein